MIRRFAVALGLALLLASPALASSRYSLRGEGETVSAGHADARSLGGAEAASSVPSLSGNPASLVFADRARFYGTWVTEWIRTEETLPGDNAVAKGYSGFVPNLGLVFPLPRGWALATGLLVTRHVDGTTEFPSADVGGVTYRQVYEASGNQLSVPVLVGWKGERVQVGTGLDLTLVNSRVRWRNDFGDNPDFVDTNDLDRIDLFGVGWRSGLRVPITPELAAGAWVSLPSDLDGKRRFENDDSDNSDDLEVDYRADAPRRFGLGLEAQPNARLRLVADWVREGWGNVTSYRTRTKLIDVDRFAAGVEWEPSRSSDRTWPLRLGYRTEPLQERDANGRKIREHVLSFGSGFGFAEGQGNIDWVLEYGWRGVVDQSEYYEQMVRFGVTLTGFEEWSRRRPPEAEEDW